MKNVMKWTPLLTVSSLLLVGCVSAVDTPSPEAVAEAVSSIDEADYMMKIGVIAHDSMQGRDTPSPGLNMTADWIASEFERYGLIPAGDDGTYLQHYAINQVRSSDAASAISGSTALEFGRDLSYPLTGPLSGDFNGGLAVISGTEGLEALSEMDLSGKHVVFLGVSAETGYRSRDARIAARALRALEPASLILGTTRGDEEWNAGISDQTTRVRIFRPWADPGGTPIFEIRERSLAAVLSEAGVELSVLRARTGQPVEMTAVEGVELALSPRVEVVQEDSAPNVVAILEGGDPALRDEYVVFSAHMDHDGIRGPDASGDSIYNGADDNASGTIAVVEIAEAFSMLETRPRRSMIFLLVSGEEKGLWGSRYYADNPTVSGPQIIANLNMDMVGRNWSDTIVVIGKEHSDLGETMNRVNADHPELNMNAIDDRWPEESFYTRSDHFNFARKGIPVLFFFNGTHEDYHRPSDQVEKIDGEKAARIAQLVFHMGLEIGNALARPQWNQESYDRFVTAPGW